MKYFDTIDQNIRDTMTGIVFGLLLITWVFIVGTTLERLQVIDAFVIVRVLTLLVVSVGVSVAIWKLKSDQDWRRSQVYLEQAKELLEKAYSTLKIDPATNYPKNDRMLWLSCSRFLLAASALSDRIVDQSQKETLEEYMCYWRFQFWELLDFDGPRSPVEDYYYEKNALHGWIPGERAPITERSIAVIYRFMKWPDGLEDRMSTEPKFSAKELKRFDTFGPKGLAKYCKQLRKHS